MTGRLELWAGAECTVARVGDDYRDEIEETGFAHRLEDIDRLAGLGVTRVRFPVLWERVAPKDNADCDWRWSDERIARLRALGVAPIVGLVHHGSGPRRTNLLDPAFPALLGDYARRVAERYPEVDAWTPVNEPLTTARFSGLYGVWYPHGRTDANFVRALLHEVQGTAAAMRAIRAVRPDAQLVQTEDLGLTLSTPALAYQADFDNRRRWLSFDLLCGRIDREHPMWGYLRHHGASEAELMALVEAPCPPDILGINHYVTSDRFLDDRLALYPHERHGGNGRHAYVDIEAARVHGEPIGGFRARLAEAWARYRLPLAITEAHIGCTREEQLRWLHQAWQGAQALRADGAEVRAVTLWASFGTIDWHNLLTRREGLYETGAFDVTSNPPRPTALVTLARELAAGQPPSSPVVRGPGWWQRDLRLHPEPHGDVRGHSPHGAPLLITGASGTLGRAFARLAELRGLPHRLLSRAELDIGDRRSIEAAIERHAPWAVVNTAGYVRVDEAEHDPRQWRENALGPALLAGACAEAGIPLVTFSSDLVFDGSAERPYVESDEPRPLNAYGRAKLEAERGVLQRHPAALVVRTAAFFGPWDPYNFVAQGLAALRRGERWRAAEDQVVSPTYVPHLVHATLDLLIDGASGLWHLANAGALSWADFARLAAREAGLDPSLVQPVSGAALGQRAPRPRHAALASERGARLPPLEVALARLCAEQPAMTDEQEQPKAA